MEYEVVWSDRAIKTAEEVVSYLRKEWTEREVDKFLSQVDEMISTIESNPKLFRASKARPNIHLALIKRKTYLVYQIRPPKKQIVLLLFWNPKQNPKKLKY